MVRVFFGKDLLLFLEKTIFWGEKTKTTVNPLEKISKKTPPIRTPVHCFSNKKQGGGSLLYEWYFLSITFCVFKNTNVSRRNQNIHTNLFCFFFIQILF